MVEAHTAPEDDPRPGSRCGAYRLVRRIGDGAMGEVFEAVQTSLKRRVAVKLLAKWAVDSAEHRELFLREGEIAARISHPNVIEVHDVGTWGRRPYLVMEFLEGQSLAELLGRERTLSETKVAELMLPILSAVAAAHDRGVLHRDLKPENIFIAETDSGITPKVLDFGISQVFTERRRSQSQLYGTPEYMAPEQAEGAEGDVRADQYALGVILHEMATGKLPFDGTSPGEVLERASGAPYPETDLDGLHEALREVILRATRRDPRDRYADLRDMALALVNSAPRSSRRHWMKTLGAASVPPPAHESVGDEVEIPSAPAFPRQATGRSPSERPLDSSRSRRRTLTVGLAVAALALLAFGAWTMTRPIAGSHEAPQRAPSLRTTTIAARPAERPAIAVPLQEAPFQDESSEPPLAVPVPSAAAAVVDASVRAQTTKLRSRAAMRATPTPRPRSAWSRRPIAPAAPLGMRGSPLDPWSH